MRGPVMTKLLSQEQVNQYHNSGFVSPVDILNQDEIRQSLTEIENFEEETGQPIDFPHKSRCHQLFSWADDLVHHPKILDAVEDIIGPDILCYHATLWVKPAKSNSFVRWHQDGTYFFLDPAKHVTAWVALTIADEKAGIELFVMPDGLRRRETSKEMFWFNYGTNIVEVQGRSFLPQSVTRDVI